MNAAPPLWKIWRNPIVRRYATARLRWGALVGWSIPVQALSAFFWLVVFLYSTKYGHISSHEAAAAAWIPILILQGFLWIMKGTFSVAVGIAREGVEGLTDAQRLTPLSAWHKVLGYLFGLPILETVLVASLLPWTAASVLIGNIPVAIVFRVHLLLVTAAVLHHAIGLVTGTVIRQKIVAGTVSQLLVIVLHFIVPFFSRLGAGPLGHLGVETAITGELQPLFLSHPKSFLRTVRFFQFDLAMTGYQWLVMAVLLSFLLIILWRKWKRAGAHLLSKPLAVAFLAWIVVMSLGEISPLVRDGTLFDPAGRSPSKWMAHGSSIAEPVARQGMMIIWAGTVGCIALLTAMLVATIITPTLEQHWSALRALRSKGPRRIAWSSDPYSALAWTAGLGLLATTGWYYLAREVMETPGLSFFLRPDSSMPVIFIAGLLIPLLTWALLLEWRGMKAAFAGAFIFWIVPIMIVVVAVLSGTHAAGWPKWLAAMSGFSLPYLSLVQSSRGLEHFPGMPDLHGPWLVSLSAHGILAAVLWYRLRQARTLDPAPAHAA